MFGYLNTAFTFLTHYRKRTEYQQIASDCSKSRTRVSSLTLPISSRSSSSGVIRNPLLSAASDQRSPSQKEQSVSIP